MIIPKISVVKAWLRRGRHQDQDWAAIWSWSTIGITVIIGLALWTALQYGQPGKLDKHGCSEENGPDRGLAILLDLTDPLGDVAQERLQDLIAKWVADVPRNTLLSVGAVRERVDKTFKVHARCKTRDRKEANPLYENPKFIGNRYQEEFIKPLNKAVGEVLSVTEAPQSPIMESIDALLVKTPGFIDATYPRRLIIVSDLLQNSNAMSFYKGGNWDRFAASPHIQRIGVYLKGINVELCPVARNKAPAGMAVINDFWKKYFSQAGAPLVPSDCKLSDL